ncbi:MAG: menaquinol-cytochrome C reductase, partial [Verrucomicrobiales bacterium]|nr:menaquinol-cytochrome C reductase [Verrucomicrobiales bacterium]
HYTAQVMTVLLVLHLMQVLIDGAYKAPREVNFWTGLLLLFLVLGISLTGYLLPWDQKGYWATKVATNLVGIVPLVGEDLQRMIVGGPDYGHHTLTRFFALHAGVLPALVILLIVGHVYLFRKHGLTSKRPHRKPDGKFWPDQIFQDAVACLAVLATVLILVFWKGGAELTAPADPAERYPARPDWYFMFLFEFLKYFEGKALIIGGVIIPGVLAALLFAIPFIESRWKRAGHIFNLVFVAILFAGFTVLTALAYTRDSQNEEYQFAKAQAQIDADRVRELARSPEGIPPIGAVEILQDDAFTQGRRIFASKCASCHTYDGHDGVGRPQLEPSAPDLKGFGSREWLAGFVDPKQIETPKYFFDTAFIKPDEDGKKSRMVEFVHDLSDLSEQGKGNLEKIIAAVSAEADLHYQAEIDERDKEIIAEGTDLFFEGIAGVSAACADCHGFDGDESEASHTPDLNGWASREWTIEFTKNPAHSRFYGKNNDRMPIFEEEGIFTDRQIELVVDWIREDWVRFGEAEEKAAAAAAAEAAKNRE